MGYSYGAGGLCCDGCGAAGKTAGTRKRTCPHKVLSNSLWGARVSMNYCYPPALCKACYAKEGGMKGVHGAKCTEGAAALQAGDDAVEAGLEAGESFVVAAFGSWHEDVPEGMTGVAFNGRAGKVTVLVPAGAYDPSAKPRLSDYPEAIPMSALPGTKQVAA